MLTGDKMETAENIAKSCKLIQPGFEILRFRLQDKLSPELAKSKSRANLDGVNEQRNSIVLRELKILVERSTVL
jgi:magnesium-transporting ATPase (P-type)